MEIYPAIPSLNLSVRAIGLAIEKERLSSSVFSKLKAAIKGSSAEYGERGQRWIVVKSSPPFPADKREKPLNTFAFNEVFQSEPLQGLEKNHGIFPNLIASCPPIAASEDINLHIAVWIESPYVNNGKVSSIASCFISVREIIHGAQSQGMVIGKDTKELHQYCHKMSMKSEFCRSPQAFCNLIECSQNVAMLSGSCVRPFRAPHAADPDCGLSTPNPLQQQYVFYRPKSILKGLNNPAIVVDERVYEPRLVTPLPLAYLENMSKAITTSLQSWRQRLILEKTRQGYFKSSEDAFRCGWFMVEVEIMRASMAETAYYTRVRPHIVKRPFVVHSPLVPMACGGANALARAEAGTPTKRRDSATSVTDSEDSKYKDAQFERTRSSTISRSRASTTTSTASSRRAQTHVNYSPELLQKLDAAGRKSSQADSSRPCTFVDVLVEDPRESFAMYLGRTNTEYFSFEPVYGTNLHADCIPSSLSTQAVEFSLRARTSGEVLGRDESSKILEAPKETIFNSIVVSEQAVLVQGEGGKVRKERELFADSLKRGIEEWEASHTTTVQGTESVFQRYLCRRDQVHLAIHLNCVDTGRKDVSSEEREAAPTSTMNSKRDSNEDTAGGKAKALAREAVSLQPSTSLNKDSSDFTLGRGTLHLGDLPLGEWHNFELPMSKPGSSGGEKPRNHSRDREDLERMREKIGPAIVAGRVRVCGPAPHQVDPACRSPSSMPYSFHYARARSGRRLELRDEERDGHYKSYLRSPPPWQSIGAAPTVEETLGDAYAWLWSVGFLGRDPLAMGDSHQSASSDGFSLRPRADVAYSVEWLSQYIAQMESLQMNLLDWIASLKAMATDNYTFRASELKVEEALQPLPINLHCQMVTVRHFLGEGGAYAHADIDADEDGMGRRPRSTRPSVDIWAHLDNSSGSTFLAPTESWPMGVVESISCGSFTAHGLGHKQGGLDSMKVDLLSVSNHLESLKEGLLQRLGVGLPGTGPSELDLPVPAPPLTSDSNPQHPPAMPTESSGKPLCLQDEGEKARPVLGSGLPPWSVEGRLASDIHASVTNLEELMLPVAKRRMLVISQILATASAAFMNKLALAEEGAISPQAAEQWLRHGILMVFECVLSMKGKERGMVEDTMSAVEALQDYQFRIIRKNSGSSHENNNEFENESDETGDNASHSRSEGDDGNLASLGLMGREILVYLPSETLSKLPSDYARLVDTPQTEECSKGLVETSWGSCVVPIRPALFTQGLDITQSLAAMTGDANKEKTTKISKEALKSHSDLQHHVNMVGLHTLNKYCHTLRPLTKADNEAAIKELRYSARRSRVIYGDRTSPYHSEISKASASTTLPSSQSTLRVHPIVAHLEDLITSVERQTKNVHMLYEVERICHILSGSRVTFCKSGKDRTGMVMTLEQSRVFGERFGLGSVPLSSSADIYREDTKEKNLDLERLIHDAQIMRQYGPRLQVCLKNIGKPVYSINKLQAQFFPLVLRPPPATLEKLFKGGGDLT